MGEQLALDFTASVSVRTRKAKKAQDEADQQTLFAAWVPNIDVHLHSPLEAVATISGSNPERAHIWLQGLTGGIRVIKAKRVAFPTSSLDRLLYVRPPAQITLDAAALAVGRAIWADKLGLKPLYVRRERQRLFASSPRWPSGLRVKDAPWTAIATCMQLGIKLNIDDNARKLLADKIAAAGGSIAKAGLAGSAVVLEASRPELVEALGLPGLAYLGEPQTGRYKLPLLNSRMLLETPGIEMSRDLTDAIRRASAPSKPLVTREGFPWTLYPFQAEDAGKGLRILETTGGALLAGDMGSGKSSAVSQEVLTPFGTMLCGEIEVGDHLVGRDGRPTRVLGVFPQGERPIFKMTFTDGSSVRVDDEHLWAVQSPVMKKRARTSENVTKWKILTTKELREGRLRDGYGNLRWYVPMCDPVEFELGKELPIHPYVLGVLLGDGSLGPKAVGLASDDRDLVEEFHALLPEDTEVKVATLGENARSARATERGCAPEDVREQGFRIQGPGARVLRDALEDLDLLGKRSWEKHVPEEYLLASVADRRALLQGLLDTDGGLKNPTQLSSVEFTSTSEALVDAVTWLVRSLGGTTRKSAPVFKTYTYKGEKLRTTRAAWRLSLQLPDHVEPFRLHRKASKYQIRQKYQPARGIVSIEPDGVEEAVCFQVEAEDKLFLLGNFCPTHNTTVSLALADHLDLWPLLVVAPLSAFSTWARQLGEMEKNWYLANGSPGKAWETISEGGHDAVVVSYDRLHAFTELIESMHFKGMIADEIQRIRNAGSRRSRAIRAISSAIPYRIGLSGTPLVNGTADLLPIGSALIPSEWPPRASEKDLADIYPGDPVESIAEHLGSYMVRRKISETGAKLPKRNDRRVVVELTPEQRKALADLEAEAEAAKEEGAFDGPSGKFNALVKLTRMRQIVGNPRQAGIGGTNPKVDAAIHLAKEYNEQGRSGVIFCTDKATYRELEDRLRQEGLRAAGMWGGTNAQERIEVERKLHAGEINWVYATIQSSAESWSASPEATCAIFTSYLYQPAILSQAEARVHRLNSDLAGPEIEIVYVHASAPGGSIDDRFVEILAHKKQLVAQVIDRESFEDNTEVHLNLSDLMYMLTGEEDAGLKNREADAKAATAREQAKKLHARQSAHAHKGKNKTDVATFKDRGDATQTLEEYRAAVHGDAELDELLGSVELDESGTLVLGDLIEEADEFDVEEDDE